MERFHTPSFRLAFAAGTCVLFTLALQLACSGVRGPESRPRAIERGVASWYGPQFDGKRTANGERYDMHAMTAAHKSLPFGTIVEVRDLDNGRTCRVRINDRGPFVRGRIVDLSYAAARALDMVGPGTARVELAVVPGGAPAAPEPVASAAPGPSEGSATAFTVQVGAFGEAERAETLRDLLARQFPDATVRSDGTWNRVQVGRFASRSEAERFRRKLEQLGWAAMVVAEP